MQRNCRRIGSTQGRRGREDLREKGGNTHSQSRDGPHGHGTAVGVLYTYNRRLRFSQCVRLDATEYISDLSYSVACFQVDH